MGYNVFQPHMSFAGASSATTNPSSSTPAPSSSFAPSSSSNLNVNGDVTALSDEEFELIIESVDDAFALLMSGTALVQQDDSAALASMEIQVNTAIATIMKMLNSLHKNKSELKYRYITSVIIPIPLLSSYKIYVMLWLIRVQVN